MNKAEFLKELKIYLLKMNDLEKKKFITYYEEIISDYIENGVSEEEAVRKIGEPRKIAEELLVNYDSVQINLPSTGSRVLNIALTIIGFPLWGSVLLMVILLVFSIYVLIWCLPFTTGIGCIGFLGTSIIGIIGSPFIISRNLSLGIIQLGSGIGAIGISVLLGIVTINLTKRFIIITKNLNNRLVALFKKKVVIR